MYCRRFFWAVSNTLAAFLFRSFNPFPEKLPAFVPHLQTRRQPLRNDRSKKSQSLK